MFTDKKFGIPQGLIDAVNKVHEAFTPVPRMAHHYEKGDKAATVMDDIDEHGNHCGHKVHFFKNGKKQESKTYYAENEPDAHDVAKQYISDGLNSLHKEEVTFSEAELEHINELISRKPSKVFKVSAKSVSTDLPAHVTNKSEPSWPSSMTTKKDRDNSGHKVTATHSAEPIVKAHHDLHAPTQKADNPRTTLTLANKPTSPADAAAAILARQRNNSSGNLKGKNIEAMDPRDVRDPIHSDKRYADWKSKQSGVGTKTLPTKVSADPAPKQTKVSAPVGAVNYTLPAGKNTVSKELPKVAKSTPGKKQAGTGKVPGKKTPDLTPSTEKSKPKTATKKSDLPSWTPKAGTPPKEREAYTSDATFKSAQTKRQNKQIGALNAFIKDKNGWTPPPAPEKKTRAKKVAEEFSEKELAHIKAIMEKE